MEIFTHFKRLEDDLARINGHIKSNLETRKSCVDTMKRIDDANAQMTGQSTAIQKSMEYCQSDFKIDLKEYAQWKADTFPAEVVHLASPEPPPTEPEAEPKPEPPSNVVPIRKRKRNEKPSL